MEPCPACMAAARDLVEALGGSRAGAGREAELATALEDATGCGALRRQRAAAALSLGPLLPLIDPYRGQAEQPSRRTLIETVGTFVEGALGMVRDEARQGERGHDPHARAATLASFAGAEAVGERLGLTLSPEQRVRGAAVVERRSRVGALEHSNATAANLLRQVDRALADSSARRVWPPRRRQVLRDGIADALRRLGTATVAAEPASSRADGRLAARHRKLVVPQTPFGHAAYADLYTAPTGAPVVLWLGGAIDDLTYERRRDTAPDAIAPELPGARAGVGADQATRPASPASSGAASLLVVSPPPGVRSLAGTRRAGFLALLRAFLDEARIEAATVHGIVGNSLGAHLGFLLAPALGHVTRVATLAGVGMVETVEAAGSLGAVAEVACFSGYDDPARPHTLQLVRWLEERRIPARLVSRRGGHGFDDYLLASAVRDALAFAAGTA